MWPEYRPDPGANQTKGGASCRSLPRFPALVRDSGSTTCEVSETTGAPFIKNLCRCEERLKIRLPWFADCLTRNAISPLRSAFGLHLADFAALGEYARAGLSATELALTHAQRSFEQGRIPIAAAAVKLTAGGALQIVTAASNSRIPQGRGAGYPTDHGETAAVRAIRKVDRIDWGRVVFATTLSPCIMCGRTLEDLHGLGLRRIAVAESSSYKGTISRLIKLKGMKVVELSNKRGIAMMEAFARRYPWDWAADIGEVPPRRRPLDLKRKPAQMRRLLNRAAALLKSDRRAPVLRWWRIAGGMFWRRRSTSGHRCRGNPCRAAVIQAMGRAGRR